MKKTCIDTDEFDVGGGEDEYLCDSDLKILSDNDLSNLKLALFIGCKTAGPEATYKLPLIVVGKGATTAIGFLDSIDNNVANEWVEDFFGKLTQGKNVYEACEELNELAKYRINGFNGVVIYGDSELSFE